MKLLFICILHLYIWLSNKGKEFGPCILKAKVWYQCSWGYNTSKSLGKATWKQLVACFLRQFSQSYCHERKNRKALICFSLGTYSFCCDPVGSSFCDVMWCLKPFSLDNAFQTFLFAFTRSMLPDVVDDFKVRNPSCTDLEPMFYSCYVFFNKFGGGMAIGISTLALQWVVHLAQASLDTCDLNVYYVMWFLILDWVSRNLIAIRFLKGKNKHSINNIK